MENIIKQLQTIVQRSKGMAAELTYVRKVYAQLQGDIDALHTKQGRLQVDAGLDLTQIGVIMGEVKQALMIVRSVADFHKEASSWEAPKATNSSLGRRLQLRLIGCIKRIRANQGGDDAGTCGGQTLVVEMGDNTQVKETIPQTEPQDEEQRASKTIEEDLKENTQDKNWVAQMQVMRSKVYVTINQVNLPLHGGKRPLVQQQALASIDVGGSKLSRRGGPQLAGRVG